MEKFNLINLISGVSEPAKFCDKNHIRNFVSNYLFNQSPKYFNNETKSNRYYKNIGGILQDLNIDENDRSQNSQIWLNELNKYDTKLLCNDIVYFNFIEISFSDLNKLLNLTIELELSSIKKAKCLFVVLHLNQEMPHFHRIYLKKDEK